MRQYFVYILASQPHHDAGVLGPETCDKATKLVCLCDAFGLPLVILQDTPGFFVGKKVEHAKLLSALSDRIREAVLCLKIQGACDDAARTSDMAKAWATRGDEIVRRAGHLLEPSGDSQNLRRLLSDAGSVMDVLEQAAELGLDWYVSPDLQLRLYKRKGTAVPGRMR